MNNQNYKSERRHNPDLLDLLIICLKYKWLIIGLLLLTYIMTFSFFYFLGKETPSTISRSKDRYYSECKLFLPENLGSVDYNMFKMKLSENLGFVDYNILKTKLLSRGIALEIGETFNLSVISQTSWDEKNNKWVTEQVYTRNDQTKTWTSVHVSNVPDPDSVATLSVKSEKNMVMLGFNYSNPDVPQKALVCGLNYLSEFYRRPVLEYYASKKEIFRKQLAEAQDPVLRGRLFEQYSDLIDKDTRAKNMKFYGLEIIEPAFVPEKISVSSTQSTRKQNKGVIIALMTLVSLVISISLIFLLEYVKKIKANDPERFNLMQKYLKFR